MNELELLRDKRILAVDDEPDILETLEEILDMCNLDKAENFETARAKIQNNVYDAAIFDIMGVNGYELLQCANRKNLPSVILTSHALTMENLVKFMRAGACSFIPKEKILDIPFFLFSAIEIEGPDAGGDAVIDGAGKAENRKQGESGGWIKKLKSCFDRKFGRGWMDEYEKGVG